MTVQADPLAELRDIHLPPAIEAWPPAPGWWLIAALIIAVVIGAIYYTYKRWTRSAYRREASRHLEKLKNDHGHDQQVFLTEFNELLKRVALTAFPRSEVANLTGEAWVAFLDETSRSHDFSMGAGQILIDGQYRPLSAVDVEALHQLGEQWIRQHQLPEDSKQ